MATTLVIPGLSGVQDPATQTALRLAWDRIAQLGNEIEAVTLTITSTQSLLTEIGQRLATVEAQARTA